MQKPLQYFLGVEAGIMLRTGTTYEGGINDTFPFHRKADNFHAYPNPFNSLLNVAIISPGNSPMMIRLLDLTGRTISETLHNPSLTDSNTISFDASLLASGSYYITLRSDRYTRIIPVFCLK